MSANTWRSSICNRAICASCGCYPPFFPGPSGLRSPDSTDHPNAWRSFCRSDIANPQIVRHLNEVSRQQRIIFAIDESFENLVERNAVELGLEVKCTKCSSWRWYALKQLDCQLTCALCLRRFSFPVAQPGASNSAKWAYRFMSVCATRLYKGWVCGCSIDSFLFKTPQRA
jgi:hypothetical protein